MSTRGGHRRFNKFNKKWNPKDKHSTGPKNQNYSHKYQDKCTKFMEQERLSEHEVGITEYLGTAAGFSGVIKARFSDFHVNEINTDGEIAKLTDTSPPKDFYFDDADTNEDVSQNVDVLPSKTWDDLKEMLESAEENKVVEVDVTTISKEDRTKIHESVKKAFGQKVIASTKTVDEKKFIEFKKYVKGVTTDARIRWPRDKGEYVHFLVYKEVVDTIEASFKISDCLRMKSSGFTYAGVKDRRAKTTQWFCVKKVDPRKLINKTRFLRNIHIGNIIFKNEPLKLGQLSGNRFRIALRNVTAEDSLINEAMESLKDNGFINYYGLQRFGNDKEVPTFQIGIKLLQGNWKEACDLILKVKSCDDPRSEITQAKRVYRDTSNSELACKEFSRSYNKCIESKLLLGFVKNHENDYVNALENVPRNMRLLYTHSFQSFVWNKIVSRRIKEFGLKPIVGDLVLLSSDQVEEAVETATVIKESNDGEEETKDNEGTNEPSINPNPEIKILTEDDLNNYTIYDIVLPLPGYDIKYPENEVKNWYKEILEEYGLTIEMPKQKVKTYTLSGAYRKILGQVKHLSWKTMKYNHPNDTLIRSDYEELTGAAAPQDNPEGQYKTLIIDFCLGSSCYATMVLREILKIDTSTTAHAKLNKYHIETVAGENGNSNKQEDVQFAEANSLLTDTAKYEAFKQQIFGATDDGPKRKADEECEESSVAKKNKTIVEKPESSIQVQPSLV